MFPDQGLNPGTLNWKQDILTTGLPGKLWLQASKIFLDCKTGKMLFKRYISKRDTEIIYNYMFSKVTANQGLELKVCSVKLREALRLSWSLLIVERESSTPGY